MKKEIKRIYHFANTHEGLPIVQTYKDFTREIELNLIFSTIHFKRTSTNPLKSIYHFLVYKKYKRFVKRKLKRISAKIHFVDDVNSPMFIESIKPDGILICSGFTQIFNTNLLSKFIRSYNIHQSLLPFYKGPVPNYWVLKNKETRTGYSIHKLNKEIDSGEILFQDIHNILDDKPSDLQWSIANQIADSFQYILPLLLNDKAFNNKPIFPKSIYNVHELYRGFPKENNTSSEMH